MILQVGIVLFLVIIAIYTVLYGIDNWKEKNYFGAIGLLLLSITVMVMPLYFLFT